MSTVEKPQTFLITIAILEGRHYIWTNMDSAAVVKIGNKKRCTSVRYNTDNPFYNEYFVFEFCTEQGKIIDKNILITVIQPRNMFRKRKILGHQFYHKWAILTSPKNDTFVGPRGYLKVDISILMKGQVSKIPFNIVNDEIEGNLLLPECPGNDRLKALYVFDVYKCEHLVEKPSNTLSDVDSPETNKPHPSGPTSFVEISFSGLTVKTSVKKNTCFPIFNERLTIIDLFPPLCQRIKINIGYVDCIKKYVYATRYINLKLISNDKEEGFLPTFGPTLLHMYFSGNLEGYAGTILMSMSTELEDIMHVSEPTKSGVDVHPIAPIDEKKRLKKIEDIYQNHHDRLKSEETDNFILDSLYFISSSGKKYADIVKQYSFECSTNLDLKRREICLKEMKLIVEKVDAIACMRCSRKTILWKFQKIIRRMEALIEDVQDCWPDVFIWMISGNKKIACRKILARDIFYSPIEEERGAFCGTIKTICFYPNKKDELNLLCKMEVMFWLGLERHKDACLQNIPEGFALQKDELELSRMLLTLETHIFDFKAYIFQGKITAGFDKSGLADTFVRVIIADRESETREIRKSLNPIWDETLSFGDIKLCGSKSFLQSNACTVLVELLDKDSCGQAELVGRCIIKPSLKFSDENKSPPKLEWHKTYLNGEDLGEILSAFELIEVSGDEKDTFPNLKYAVIPAEIKPELTSYKVEVLFWGVRDLGRICCVQINRPRISLNFGEETLYSDTIDNARKNSNFPNQCKSILVVIPSQKEYAPPLCLKIHDSRRFGIYAYAGVHITSVSSFLINPLTARERDIQVSGLDKSTEKPSECDMACVDCKTREDRQLVKCSDSNEKKRKFSDVTQMITMLHNFASNTKSSLGTYEPLPQEEPEFEGYDWWTKFYASLEQPSTNPEKNTVFPKNKLKIYETELECQPEFNGFNDMLISFEMYKGKRTGDETVDEENITAILKGNVKIYPWLSEQDDNYVIPNGLPLKNGIFQCFPSNDVLNYVLRAYCVRAIGLRPKDLNGKSDPYLCLTLHDKVDRDIGHVIPGQLNPIFGRCYEFYGAFPLDHTLKIAVWDRDFASADDLIGETKIDVENRFYTKHRALCGIAETYEESGYCAWRGQRKPTVILSDLCKRWRTETPEYRETSVKAAVLVNADAAVSILVSASPDPHFDKEVLALAALRRWSEMPVVGFTIVPEHVETRSLYHPTKPGIEQGKIQLWIDIFPIADLPPPKQVVITPRKPVAYELRVIIWNTDEVPLDEDDFFIGEKKSDIYVKGWLADSLDPQYTDVHYKSLTGEGNFNWRFIFPFNYLSSENKLVIRRKESLFALNETECKIPCRLTLQVWDNDTFSRDDFLGTLTLELSRMPRGARVSKKCDLHILDASAPTINLFKIRRTKGWWPFTTTDCKSGTPIMRGKVEAELEILTLEEAEKCPAGLGRNDPQGLSAPNRPDVSFSWFKNPFRAVYYVVCKLHKWKIIKAVLCILLIALIFVAIRAFPEYTVKRLLGA